jgi:hypothetical protein
MDAAFPEPSPAPRGTAEQAFSAGELQWLAASLAERFAELYAATPLDPRALCAGNVLTFTFQGGLAHADEKLLEVGAGEKLQRFREAFLRALADDFSAVISRSGASVSSFLPAFDVASRTTHLIFILELPLDPAEEERRAIANWSMQARRNARELRRRHRRSSETHQRLKAELDAERDRALAERSRRPAAPAPRSDDR